MKFHHRMSAPRNTKCTVFDKDRLTPAMLERSVRKRLEHIQLCHPCSVRAQQLGMRTYGTADICKEFLFKGNEALTGAGKFCFQF